MPFCWASLTGCPHLIPLTGCPLQKSDALFRLLGEGGTVDGRRAVMLVSCAILAVLKIPSCTGVERLLIQMFNMFCWVDVITSISQSTLEPTEHSSHPRLILGCRRLRRCGRRVARGLATVRGERSPSAEDSSVTLWVYLYT